MVLTFYIIITHNRRHFFFNVYVFCVLMIMRFYDTLKQFAIYTTYFKDFLYNLVFGISILSTYILQIKKCGRYSPNYCGFFLQLIHNYVINKFFPRKLIFTKKSLTTPYFPKIIKQISLFKLP